ncbi:MAG: ankyrin repeat domain-containing protein, partial [Rickettsiales bacterium]
MRYLRNMPQPPRRRGLFRIFKFIIVAAILGSIFRQIAPSVGLLSSAGNISGGSMFGSSGIGSVGGRIGEVGGGSMFSGGITTLRKKDATPLIRAAIAGDKKVVKKLLIREIPINGYDIDGRTAIIGAAYHEQNAICALLIAKGADPYIEDKKGFNAFDFAAARGLVKTVKLLLRASDSPDKKHYVEYAIIMQAAFASDTRLLPKGKRKISSINRLSPEDKSPLHIAANSGSVDMARELMSRGAEVNLTN